MEMEEDHRKSGRAPLRGWDSQKKKKLSERGERLKSGAVGLGGAVGLVGR